MTDADIVNPDYGDEPDIRLSRIDPAISDKFDVPEEPARAVYHDIEDWYRTFIPTEDGKLIIERFNKKEAGKDISMITDLKKIDFVLWKWRDRPFIICDGADK